MLSVQVCTYNISETHFSGKTMCYGQILAELCTDVSHSYW